MSEAESYYQERLLRGVMTKAFQLDYDVLIFTSFVKVSFLKAVSAGEMQIYDAINYDKLDGVIVLADTSGMIKRQRWQIISSMADVKSLTLSFAVEIIWL